MKQQCWMLFLLNVVILNGCGWRDEVEWDRAVLSSSGEELVMVKTLFEAKTEFARDAERNRRFEIWTAPVSAPEDRVQLGETTEGCVIDLFYMHAQGRVLIGVNIDLDNEDDDRRRVRWIDMQLDGSQRVLAEATMANPPLRLEEYDAALRFLPSPDGSSVAKLDASSRRTLSIQLLNGEDLEPTGDVETLTINGSRIRSAWQQDGTLAFRVSEDLDDQEFEDYSMTAGSAPEAIAPLSRTCFRPSTTSSSWTADGRHAHVNPEGDFVFEDDAGFRHFGCHVSDEPPRE